ncbi:hypothetical protein [Streptomyces sp. NPDC060027]|uniref:hypothetical protein n=1 Tax=Streptomyces sp. NPDC060027 TaxID=3347040 RepID=UPI00368D30DE
MAVRDWGVVRALLGKIGTAEAGVQGSTTAVMGTGYAVAGTGRRRAWWRQW